jgi:hypothetical protein
MQEKEDYQDGLKVHEPQIKKMVGAIFDHHKREFLVPLNLYI